jgi:hypothetical protein
MIDTSVEHLTENVQRLCCGLAQEIARRVAEDPLNSDGTPYHVEHHATLVLIDWFLGDYIPPVRGK